MRALDGLRLFLPIVAFALVSQLAGEPRASRPFDEVAAQVIPVLLLALALEARFFRLHRIREPLDLAAALFTMLVLGCGEFYAFQGTLANRPEHAGLIGGAVAAGFVAVAVAALTGPEVTSKDD
jgi:O-antigen ligase